MKLRFYKFYVSAAILLASQSTQAQIINRFAGGDTTGGFGGDGGLAIATACKLNQPMTLTRDASGNIYIGEGNGNRIRKVNTSGIISTYAGTGTSGYSGDGGQATAATFIGPDGITFNSSGDLVMVDFGNHCIRKITTSTGIISTIAGTGGSSGSTGDGGPATAALFNHPRDVRYDAAGNLYICDWSNYKIRKIDVSGNISTITGIGSGGYTGDGGPATAATNNLPYQVAFDPFGDLYFVDGGNNSIRKITMSTGIISTVAGDPTGLGGFSGDGGPASAAKLSIPTSIEFSNDSNMYIADRGNGRIRKVNHVTGIISTVVGTGPSFETGDGGPATAAQINKPFDLMFDAENNLYLADINGNTVRVVRHVPTLGVQQFTTSNQLSVFPNPSNGSFTIQGSLSTNSNEQAAVEIFNAVGQRIYTTTIEIRDGVINAPININKEVPYGMYILHLRSASEANITTMVMGR